MQRTEEEKEALVKELVFTSEHYPHQPKGGQQVAMCPRGMRADHKELNFSVYVECRTQVESRKACIKIFKAALDLIE